MANQPTSLAAPVWRQFPFFDVVPVNDVHDLASTPETFKNTPEVATIMPSSIGLLVADIHGSIHVLDRTFEIQNSWIVHHAGRVTHMIENRGILVTLGEEDGNRHPMLKIWDLEHSDKKSGIPVLLRSVKVQHGNRPHPVSSIALASGLSQLAIGLSDGTVLFYRLLDQYLFANSNNLTNLPKPRVVHESKGEPITGLGFREPKTTDDPKTEYLYLFIVTTNHVYSYQVTGRGSGGTPVVVDEVGCDLGCAAVNHRATDMIVAREEAIYSAHAEGRGGCWVYEGPKSSVLTHRNYLVIVSPPFVPTAGSASATIRHLVARTPGIASGTVDISKVTVFDLENNLVGHSSTFKEGVREVFSCWGSVYVLCNDGKLFRLNEASTSSKLDVFFTRGLFIPAIAMAKSQGLDEASLADIHRRYGDHLYAKGDFDGAMQQYLQTLGNLQPSYVIRKYLDAQRIHSLAVYLQELHSRGLANSDHTTLLLNTYTKLKDITRLDAFIKAESSTIGGELPFDLDTAIRVCRQAGYYEHAVYLAKKHGKHEDYLRIQIEDAHKYKDALDYLRSLGPAAAENNLTRYGRLLLSSIPEETTHLLVDICTGSGFALPVPPPERAAPTERPNTVGSFIPYLNRASLIIPSDAASGKSTIKETTILPGQPSNSFEPGHATRSSISKTSSPRTGSRASSPPPPLAAKPRPLVRRPSPRLYFAHFIEHPAHFLRFLEAVALARWGQKVDVLGTHELRPTVTEPPADEDVDRADQIAIWNTLIELYLTLSSNYMSHDPPNPQGAKVMEDKALNVLKSPFTFDTTHALLVCSTRGFTEGLVLLWEKLGMYEDVLRFWMDKENNSPADESVDIDPHTRASAHVLYYLEKYGPQHPYLYPLVLRFLTSTPTLLQRHTQDLSRILEHIEQEKIMPPLLVVQILSRNNVASVGLVKQWLMRRMSETRDEIDADRRLINSYRDETVIKTKEIEELSDPNNSRVFHVTRCSACGGPPELPTIHFMCKHSYHQRCLGGQETECPTCARQHGVIREIRRNNERLADQHELFLADVEESGFNAVASAFSRGLMGPPRLDEVATR